MTINVLDRNTIQNLHSGQVIVDIESIVKELIENSLDAHATSIEVVFINNGLESIQVRDDGDGVEQNDRQYVAQNHYTSKLINFDDLESISSYGFRGEALHAMCSLSDHVIIATKTKNDIVGKQYDLNKEGAISNEKPTNTIPKSGTIVTLYKPFYKVPVRRQLAQKNTTQNNKRCQELLIKYALAYPNVRFSLHQARDTVGYTATKSSNSWIKPITPTIEKSIAIIFGPQIATMVEQHIETDPDHPGLTINMILPKQNSDPSVVYKGGDRVFIYVNQRPINYAKSELKELVGSIRTKYREAIGLSDNNKKNPFMYVDIQISPDEYDVNIEPNKTTVYFHDKNRICDLVVKMLDAAYPNKIHDFLKMASQSIVDEKEQEEPLFTSDSPIVKKVNILASQHAQPQLVSSVQENTNIFKPAATSEQHTSSPPPPSNNEPIWSLSMLSDDDDEEEPSKDIAGEFEPATTVEQNSSPPIHKERMWRLPMMNNEEDEEDEELLEESTKTAEHTSPSPPFNQESISRFSIISDDEDEEPPEYIGNMKTSKTPMANWQIEPVSSVIELTLTSKTKNIPPHVAAAVIPEDDLAWNENYSQSSTGATIAEEDCASDIVNGPSPTIVNISDDELSLTDSALVTELLPPASPSVSTPQKRTLSEIFSFNETPRTSPNKRTLSIPTGKQRQASISDIVEDFVSRPSRSPEITHRQTQRSSRPISVSPVIQRQASPTMAPPQQKKTTEKASNQLTLSQAFDQKPQKAPHQLTLLQTFAQKQQKARIQSKLLPTPASMAASTSQPTTTLNHSMKIQCNIDEIRANYPAVKKRHDETHDISIEEFLTHQKTMPKKDDSDAHLISKSTIKNGLSFYSRNGVSEIGLVKLKAMCINNTYNELFKEHKIICKKTLDRPVQIQFHENDPLCAPLIALETNEVLIADDLHGGKYISYYDIIEDCIVWNGFRARWRKDYSSHNLIIQFTAIYSLGSGYGPADFREILDRLSKSNTFVRPTKICDHLWALAEKIYQQEKSPKVPELQEILQDLTWAQLEAGEWESGRTKNGRVVACRLANC